MIKTDPIQARVVDVDVFTKPKWVEEILGDRSKAIESIREDGLAIEVVDSGPLRHVQVVARNAIELDSRAFQECVVRVYRAMRSRLEERAGGHPLRFWNFVPDIHGPGHDGQDRYEVFNAGRYESFLDWYGARHLESRMVAASGVDHLGRDFVVQVLAGELPGHGVENPRQQAAYRYSKRYGPVPPCFARATLAPHPTGDADRRMMVVAGTASIVGEDSCHLGQFERQFVETCRNLESLIEMLDPAPGASERSLSDFRELRVYLVDEEKRGELLALLDERFPGLEHLELMTAALCRRDLLVEMEGVVSTG